MATQSAARAGNNVAGVEDDDRAAVGVSRAQFGVSGPDYPSVHKSTSGHNQNKQAVNLPDTGDTDLHRRDLLTRKLQKTRF